MKSLKEIQDLPIYRRMCTRDRWRNFQTNQGHRRGDFGKHDLISNKGAGYVYIIENTELIGWFKVGISQTEENFKNRMQSYKSTIPIGKWNRVYFEYTDDLAKEELKIKQFFKFECDYEMGINSREWFKGDWSVINKIDVLKKSFDYKPQRVCVKRYSL